MRPTLAKLDRVLRLWVIGGLVFGLNGGPGILPAAQAAVMQPFSGTPAAITPEAIPPVAGTPAEASLDSNQPAPPSDSPPVGSDTSPTGRGNPHEPTGIAPVAANSSVMFIENVGQFDTGARFKVQGAGGTIFLAPDAIWVTLLEHKPRLTRPMTDALPALDEIRPGINAPALDEIRNGVNLKLSFEGANPTPQLEGFGRIDTHISYFLGNDPAQWHPDVPVWSGVRYVDIYPGVDLVVTSENGQWSWELATRNGNVPPGLTAARLKVEGADALNVQGGRMRLTTAVGDFSLPTPNVLTPGGGVLAEVLADLILPSVVITPTAEPQATDTPTPEASATATLSPTATATATVTDTPTIEASATLTDTLTAVPTETETLTATATPSQTPTTTETATLMPTETLTPTESVTPQSLWIGYSPHVRLKVAGQPRGTAYDDRLARPIFKPLFAPAPNNPADLLYATYLGGSADDVAWDVATDNTGAAYVTGETFTGAILFPITLGAFSTTIGLYNNVFALKISASGGLVYSAYLGGDAYDRALGIAVDTTGAIYVTGVTSSTNFPMLNAYQPLKKGIRDAFIAKLNPTGNALIFSTHLGGDGSDFGNSIAVDASGAAYVTGETASYNFPLENSFRSVNSGVYSDAFVTKFSADGSSLIYSSYLGGNTHLDVGESITVDAAGTAYIAGWTASTDFITTTNALQSTNQGIPDAFVTKVDTTGNLLYSTYLGGNYEDYGRDIAIDGMGGIYVTGLTNSSILSTTNAFQYTNQGGWDAFVTKINPGGATLAYLTYLGSSEIDEGRGIAVNALGEVYVSGVTTATSNHFPTTPTAYQRISSGGYDVFVTKLSSAGSVLLYSSYLGGSLNDYDTDMALTANGAVYIVGATSSTDFPTTSGAIDSTPNGLLDVLVAKIKSSSSLPPSQAFATNECPFCNNQNRVYLAGRNINAYSGNYNYQQRSGQTLSLGLQPLAFEQSYNSLATGANISYPVVYSNVLGYGWTHNFNVRLVFTPTGETTNTVMLIAPRGSQMRFTDNGNGSYTPYAGVLVALTRTTTAPYIYTATTNSQYTYVFSDTGQLRFITDPLSQTTTLTYTNGQLTQIRDALGQQGFELQYTGSALQYVKERIGGALTGRAITYTLDGSNNLTGVTDFDGRAWTYIYTGTKHLLWKVVDPTSKTLVQTLYADNDGRATTQYDGAGNLLATVVYTPTADPNQRAVKTFNPQTGNLVTTTLTYDTGGLPQTASDPQGNQTNLAFSDNLNPSSVTDALSNTTQIIYDAVGNPTAVTDPFTRTTRLAYDALNHLVLVTDALTHTTIYTYSGNCTGLPSEHSGL